MPLDIVIFGVIAVILIFRFLGILGQNDKSDGRPRRDAFGSYKKSVEQARLRREEERERAVVSPREKKRERAVVPPREKTRSRRVPQRDAEESATLSTTLTDKAFLEGAKSAFAMILDAYATGDQQNLKTLLDKELLERMKSDIEERQVEQRLEISLLEIVEARVVERKQDERYEQIVVAFTSKQCHLLFDKNNKLIEGDPDKEELVSDLWTFRQEIASQDPSWFLCATRSQVTPKHTPKKKPAPKLVRKKTHAP